jgi:hypothetical protein
MFTANGGRVCTTFNRLGMLRDNFWQAGSRVKRRSVEFALQIAVAGVDDYRDADASGQRT